MMIKFRQRPVAFKIPLLTSKAQQPFQPLQVKAEKTPGKERSMVLKVSYRDILWQLLTLLIVQENGMRNTGARVERKLLAHTRQMMGNVKPGGGEETVKSQVI